MQGLQSLFGICFDILLDWYGGIPTEPYGLVTVIGQTGIYWYTGELKNSKNSWVFLRSVFVFLGSAAFYIMLFGLLASEAVYWYGVSVLVFPLLTICTYLSWQSFLGLPR